MPLGFFCSALPSSLLYSYSKFEGGALFSAGILPVNFDGSEGGASAFWVNFKGLGGGGGKDFVCSCFPSKFGGRAVVEIFAPFLMHPEKSPKLVLLAFLKNAAYKKGEEKVVRKGWEEVELTDVWPITPAILFSSFFFSQSRDL